MDLPTNLRFQGYTATPPLWQNPSALPFEQLELPLHAAAEEDDSISFTQQRLGKLVEEFVFHQLNYRPNLNWIATNLQIRDGKRTVGEIDALYLDGQQPVHLEIAYKFYLFDNLEQHPTALARWIGPNRKDHLSLKLKKLKTRQFPLLSHPYTEPYLNAHQLKAAAVRQVVCFKAQLFLPFDQPTLDASPLNPACIAGFYIHQRELKHFAEYQFYLPTKLDWLVIPHPAVTWVNLETVRETITTTTNQQRSPMLWLKAPDGKISKCFVVFW